MDDSLRVEVGAEQCAFRLGGQRVVIGVGESSLVRSFHADPPRADELSNAIGEVHDHLDDVLRELPGVAETNQALFAGGGIAAVADVEVGGAAVLPLRLGRDAAEDVFRTVATESRARRARNPGLQAHRVDAVLGAACVLVAVMRRLRLEHVLIVEDVGA